MVTQSILVDRKLAKELEKLAKRTGRAAAEIATDALRGYLEHTQRLLDDIDAARRDVAAGRTFTVDEVRANLAKQRSARLKKKPAR